nr:arsenate reductase family protein [Merdimonas faecis]
MEWIRGDFNRILTKQRKRGKEMLFVCYPKCTTCKKAEKWLQDQGLEFEKRDIKLQNPSKEELKEWHQKSGLPLKRFFNTSGNLYKEMKLKDKLPEMTEEEQYDLLATDGMLVKRPILVTEDKVLVGFREKEWSQGV